MYLKSRQLSERIKAVTEEADRLTDHVCAFEEFIALPFFGQIILRFNLNKDEFTVKEVWRFESILRMAAGEEFLTDFMGSVYRKAGLDFSLLEIRLRELDRQLRDESGPSPLHAEGIRSDGAFLLRAAGLDPELPVWEIQPEGDGFYLLVLGKEPKQIKAVEEPFRISVSEVEERACTGLIKAALYAGRNNVSLLWLLKDGTAWK